MHCQVAFKFEHICNDFPKSFWQKDYKKHRAGTLFDLERSQCVATIPFVKTATDHDEIRDDLTLVRDEIKRLRRALAQTLQRERDLSDRLRNNDRSSLAKQVSPNSEHHTPCNTVDCRGFVTKIDSQCACCKNRTCHNCQRTISPRVDDDEQKCAETDSDADIIGAADLYSNHECHPDDVATVQELRRNSKQCPECRVNISKVDGCDQMFCVSCHTAFSWNTGLRMTGPIHNPHYFEVRAQLGACVHLPVRGGCDDVLPDFRMFRNAMFVAMPLGSAVRSAPDHVTLASELTLRYAIELNEVILHQLIENGGREYSFHTNLKSRVAWMRKKTTDDEFRLLLYRSDKKCRLHGELHALFQMYVNVVGMLFHNMMVQKSTKSYPDIIMLKRYTREQLLAIKVRYNSTSSEYDKYVT